MVLLLLLQLLSHLLHALQMVLWKQPSLPHVEAIVLQARNQWSKSTLSPGKLEDVTLLRSYESYRDWQMIADKAFPIYGRQDSSKQKSAAQLRARYQQIKPKRKPRLDSAILAEWLAPPNEQDDDE